MATLHVPLGIFDDYLSKWSEREAEDFAFVVAALEGEDALGAQVDVLLLKLSQLDGNEDHLLALRPF